MGGGGSHSQLKQAPDLTLTRWYFFAPDAVPPKPNVVQTSPFILHALMSRTHKYTRTSAN
eukprot:2353248-Prymnesium_polylepis.3